MYLGYSQSTELTSFSVLLKNCFNTTKKNHNFILWEDLYLFVTFFIKSMIGLGIQENLELIFRECMGCAAQSTKYFWGHRWILLKLKSEFALIAQFISVTKD